MSGKLFLIVGPSGVGKGTLVHELREKHPEFFFPVSATTRAARDGEEEGKQYYFLSEERFDVLEEAGDFLETAVVHGTERYGLLRKPIMEAIKAGMVVVREVDIQGLRSVHQNLEKENFEAIFLLPPDMDTLKKRILKRQPNMAEDELARRLQSAEHELTQKSLADFEVVSDDGGIAKMVSDVEEIIANNT